PRREASDEAPPPRPRYGRLFQLAWDSEQAPYQLLLQIPGPQLFRWRRTPFPMLTNITIAMLVLAALSRTLSRYPTAPLPPPRATGPRPPTATALWPPVPAGLAFRSGVLPVAVAHTRPRTLPLAAHALCHADQYHHRHADAGRTEAAAQPLPDGSPAPARRRRRGSGRGPLRCHCPGPDRAPPGRDRPAVAPVPEHGRQGAEPAQQSDPADARHFP